MLYCSTGNPANLPLYRSHTVSHPQGKSPTSCFRRQRALLHWASQVPERERAHTRHFGTFHLLYLLSYSCLRVRPSQVSSYTTKAVLLEMWSRFGWIQAQKQLECQKQFLRSKLSHLAQRRWRAQRFKERGSCLDRPHRKQDNPSKQSSSLWASSLSDRFRTFYHEIGQLKTV